MFNNMPEGTQAQVAEHRVRYLMPLNYRNIPARVEVWIGAINGASLTVAYAIHDPVTGAQCVAAETVLAFFQTDTRTLLRVDAGKKALLRPLLGASNFR
ncbi:hypothetical protein [Paenarthrobacter sp. PH39-S1]|uniref:acyl-CoA thioesterase n=1 Tax=Paenarthrobacter sp. PH39-S1 TaxID=3046204 RepID=UPI0032D992FC